MNLKTIKNLILFSCLSFCSLSLSAQGLVEASKVEKKVDQLISQLTLEEKIHLLHGRGKEGYVNETSIAPGVRGVARLGIPNVFMGQGVTGAREGRATKIHPTYICTPMAMGCTWDVELHHTVGDLISKEMRALGLDLNLGPRINVIRNPMGGRSWESLSEDPYFNSRFIVPYVQIMQQNGIICGPKHYAANSQDHNRFDINNIIDERTLREIYLPAYQAAVVEGGALNMMASYNRLNGEFACENKYLLTDILRDEWGFDGFVLSEFLYGMHTTMGAVNAGMNVEMSAPKYYGDPMKDAIDAGELSVETVDNLLREYLMVVYRMGIDSRKRYDTSVEVHSERAIEVAREVAQNSPVLLKNSGILPLKASDYKSVAVLGPLAQRQNESLEGSPRVADIFYMQGAGSACLNYSVEALIEPVAAMGAELSSVSKLNYAQGCCPPYDYAKSKPVDVNNVQEVALRQQAVEIAKSSDMAVIFVGQSGANEGEGSDRLNCQLPGCQDELINAVAEVNKNVIVVVVSGSYIDISAWEDKVSAVLYAPYCGEQISNGVVDVLYGKVSPSGRLPISWANCAKDYPENSIFRGGPYSETNVSNVYTDGIYVGYRYFDQYNVDIAYPFGYGLSYSEFEYKNISVKKKGKTYEVSVQVKNVGAYDAKEVVQLYVSDLESSVERPKKELKGFVKLDLKRGETQTASFTLDDRSFAFYDVKSKDWKVESGAFDVWVGSHSRNLPLKAEIKIK